MTGADVLLTPSLPVAAPYIGQDRLEWADGEETVPDALIRFPAPFNITGQPALSLPCGFDAGRPVGIQIIGRPSTKPRSSGWEQRSNRFPAPPRIQRREAG